MAQLTCPWCNALIDVNTQSPEEVAYCISCNQPLRVLPSDTPRRSVLVPVLLACGFALIILGFGLGSYFLLDTHSSDETLSGPQHVKKKPAISSEENPATSITKQSALPPDVLDPGILAPRIRNSLALIESPQRSATGMVVADGILLTPASVLENAFSCELLIWFSEIDDKPREAERVLMVDSENDLALVEFIGAIDRLTLAESPSPRLDESLMAFAYATSISRSECKFLRVTVIELRDDHNNFAFSSEPVPETNGGPLINEYGEVIGIIAVHERNLLSRPIDGIRKTLLNNPNLRGIADAAHAAREYQLLISRERSRATTLQTALTRAASILAKENGNVVDELGALQTEYKLILNSDKLNIPSSVIQDLNAASAISTERRSQLASHHRLINNAESLLRSNSITAAKIDDKLHSLKECVEWLTQNPNIN